MLKLLDRRFSGLSDDLLHETARAMQNGLCSYLLSLSNSNEVLETARGNRNIELERRRKQFEEIYERDFTETFNFDQWADSEDAGINDQSDDEEVAILSQALSSQGL